MDNKSKEEEDKLSDTNKVDKSKDDSDTDVEMLIPKDSSGRNSKISMLAGQGEVSGVDNEKVILTARTSKKPEK